MDKASKMLAKARKMPIPEVKYKQLEPKTPSERRALIRAHNKLQSALEAWEALSNELHQAARDDGFVQQEVDQMLSSLEGKVRFCSYEAEQAAADEKSAREAAETLRAAGLRPIQMASIEAIYRSAARSYNESHAMLVDDIMAGANKAAKRVGLSGCWDGWWFPIVASNVRAFRPFSSISDEQKQEMLEKAREEQLYNARRGRKGR